MGNVYFFTGYPGFLSRELIKELLRSHIQIEKIFLLVLPSMKEEAHEQLVALKSEEDIQMDLFSIIEGDITKDNLGMTENVQTELMNNVTHVYHLAAIYDLAVEKTIAEKVNIQGTNYVNQWVKKLKQVKRYTYFSTAYISGNRQGKIYEKELQMNQSFKNHYESTKYEGEILVRKQMPEVPTTVIRPGIVRGHSKTGETLKFDGAYFILHLLERLKHLPVIPQFGDGKAEGNFVPLDYVIQATIYLSHLKQGVGKTYHLTDPAPFKMSEVYRMLSEEYLGKTPKGKIPISIAKASLHFPFMRKWLQVEKEALVYNTCLSSYDCREAQKDLKGSGIHCPSFDKTVKTMVQYYRDHKDDQDKYIKVK